MSKRTPLWRYAFDSVERPLAATLEASVRSELFFDLLAVTTRARKGTLARTERLSRRALHLLNLPAGSDMRRLSEQIARLERRVAQLTKQLGDERPAVSTAREGLVSVSSHMNEARV